jgi:hypothetical protein
LSEKNLVPSKRGGGGRTVSSVYTTTDISPLRSSLIRVGWETSLILHPPSFWVGDLCVTVLSDLFFFSISLWLLSRASWSLTSMCQLSTTTAEGGVGQRHLLSSGRTSRATPPQHTHTQSEKKIKRLAARPAQGAFELPLSHSTVGGATRRNQLLGSPPSSP